MGEAIKNGIFSIDPETVIVGSRDALGEPRIMASGLLGRGRYVYIGPVDLEFWILHPTYVLDYFLFGKKPMLSNAQLAEEALNLYTEEYPDLIGRVVLGVDVGINRKNEIVYRHRDFAFWMSLDDSKPDSPQMIEGLALDTPSLVEARMVERGERSE